MTRNGYVPDPQAQQTLIIRTVVFDDGTYDGLVEPAAEIQARRRGLNIQRARILTLLRDAITAEAGDTSLDALKERVYGLANMADASVVSDLITSFPSLGEKRRAWLQQKVENGLSDGKREVLRYITQFEDSLKQPGSHLTFPEWLAQTRTNYERQVQQL
jgi:hypothetical protein